MTAVALTTQVSAMVTLVPRPVPGKHYSLQLACPGKSPSGVCLNLPLGEAEWLGGSGTPPLPQWVEGPPEMAERGSQRAEGGGLKPRKTMDFQPFWPELPM